MAKKVSISINGEVLEAEEGKNILEVALENNIYIPNLCYHPDVSSGPGKKANPEVYRGDVRYRGEEGEYQGCQLCTVSVNGEVVKACEFPVREGLKIETDNSEISKLRQENLSKILANHPHVCITCSYREGCDRIQCTFGYPVEERCCDLFSKCELRYIAEYIGVSENTPKYVFSNQPVVEEKLYRWNWNYCIGCTRCVRGCMELREANALGFALMGNEIVVGRTAITDKESGCKYCGVCVEICPTGVVRDIKRRQKNKWRDSVSEKMLPPLHKAIPLIEENIADIPEKSGVIRLYNENMEVVYIKGTENLRDELTEQIGKAEFFDYVEYEMFTMKESEMIQEYLQKHGKMPKYNDELEDLF